MIGRGNFDFVQPTPPRYPPPNKALDRDRIKVFKNRERIKLGIIGLPKTRTSAKDEIAAKVKVETPRNGFQVKTETPRNGSQVESPRNELPVIDSPRRRKSVTCVDKTESNAKDATPRSPESPAARPGTCPTSAKGDVRRRISGRLALPSSEGASPTNRRNSDNATASTADAVSPASVSSRRIGSDSTPTNNSDDAPKRDGKLVFQVKNASQKQVDRERLAGGPVIGWDWYPVDQYDEQLWEQQFCAYAAQEWARAMQNEKSDRAKNDPETA